MRYHFKVHKVKDGYWAECVELPGCVTQGDSKEELLANMHEALNLYIEECDDSENLAPLPKKMVKLTSSIVEISLDPSAALAFSLRHQRIKNGQQL